MIHKYIKIKFSKNIYKKKKRYPGGGHVVLHHEVGRNTRRRPGKRNLKNLSLFCSFFILFCFFNIVFLKKLNIKIYIFFAKSGVPSSGARSASHLQCISRISQQQHHFTWTKPISWWQPKPIFTASYSTSTTAMFYLDLM